MEMDEVEEVLPGSQPWAVRDRSVTMFSTLFSTVHTLLVVAVGFPSVFLETQGLGWSWASYEEFLLRRNPPLQTALFRFSVLYYITDCILLAIIIYRYWRAAIPSGKGLYKLIQTSWPLQRDFGFILHHAACLCGLLGSLAHGRDSILITIGFAIGETSNPPRIAITLINLFPLKLERFKGWKQSLASAHLVMFMATRVLLAKFVSSVLSQYAVLPSTLISAVSILALSLVATAITAKGTSHSTAFVV
mmetsp:Transcript_22368/g.42001  ORF Transcript_22368/g.42001 Transcript_22368/m.42001 type:complete len:248 (-) Transcript_22368:256-999(-)